MPDEVDAREIEPGADGDSDAGLLEYIRGDAESSFHLCGTTRMGTDDMAVVDPQLRVRGVDGLRVIDASVMPTIPSVNIHPAVLMIGEKAADLVKGRTTPPQGATSSGAEAGARDGSLPSRVRDLMSDVRAVAGLARKNSPAGAG